MSWIFGWGRERGGRGFGCFISPKWLFLLLNLKFLCTQVTFFFCVVKRMFLIWPCIFCIGSHHHFYKRKKKIRRVLVLIKRYQCSRCRAVVTWWKSFTLQSRPAWRSRRYNFNLYLLSHSLCLFNMLNTLAGIEPVHFFLSHWYLSNSKKQNKNGTPVDPTWLSSSGSNLSSHQWLTRVLWYR